MTGKKFIIGVVAATIAILAGAVLLAGRLGTSPQVGKDAGVRVSVDKTAYDWGKVDLNGGNVEAYFQIENKGSQKLKLFDVKTSCMCTTAQLILGEKSSPLFGMHGNSSYVLEILPGESAQLKVVFDPAYHGPSGIGPITRQIEVSTNDTENSLLSFMLTATVVR